MQAEAGRLRQSGKRIVFVPTMGVLHEGHLSLMREGDRHGDILVVSIFVNPTQFASHEDFDEYPRDLERDMKLAKNAGVDILFTPRKQDLYPDGFQSEVKLTKLPAVLCGITRPIFFTGVATVVTKLFNIVRPHVAVFGEKDYQQLVIIRRMVQDLNFGIEIIGGSTVREPVGIAISSRNAYLTLQQRSAALSLYQALCDAQEQIRKGEKDTGKIIKTAHESINAYPETKIEYIAVIDPDTLVDMAIIDRPARMALAVNVGGTRLIDNMLLNP